MTRYLVQRHNRSTGRNLDMRCLADGELDSGSEAVDPRVSRRDQRRYKGSNDLVLESDLAIRRDVSKKFAHE